MRSLILMLTSAVGIFSLVGLFVSVYNFYSTDSTLDPNLALQYAQNAGNSGVSFMFSLAVFALVKIRAA